MKYSYAVGWIWECDVRHPELCDGCSKKNEEFKLSFNHLCLSNPVNPSYLLRYLSFWCYSILAPRLWNYSIHHPQPRLYLAALSTSLWWWGLYLLWLQGYWWWLLGLNLYVNVVTLRRITFVVSCHSHDGPDVHFRIFDVVSCHVTTLTHMIWSHHL